MKEFSKKLLFADYIITLLLIAGFFICVALNGLYAKEFYIKMVNNCMDMSSVTIPQLFNLDGFGIMLSSWILQLGLSSGAYYVMSKSDHKIQLPMAMINTMPDDIKERIDITQVITTVLTSIND